MHHVQNDSFETTSQRRENPTDTDGGQRERLLTSEKTNVAPERDAPLDLDSELILIQSYKSPFP